MPIPEAAEDPSFATLLDHIEASLGFATSVYNDAYLDRRISSRMRRTRIDDYDEYRRLLEADPDECEALLDSLSVNVTSFFRNPDVWVALRSVLRDLSDQRRRVRVWSAACSDGREAYSLAMLAHDDPGVDERRVEILGTDIKPEILRAAREGVYYASETNDVAGQLDPLGDYERFVDHEDGRFQIADSIRRMVTFVRHDLVRESPPGTFDLLLCRNFFIYVDSAAKRAVFETLGGALRDGSYLTIGMTETIPQECRSQYHPVEKRLRIYRAAAEDRSERRRRRNSNGRSNETETRHSTE